MLLDVRWDETWTDCEHCGRAIRRTLLIEDSATGRRLHVGKVCAREYGIKS